jgi:hypothetical protein
MTCTSVLVGLLCSSATLVSCAGHRPLLGTLTLRSSADLSGGKRTFAVEEGRIVSRSIDVSIDERGCATGMIGIGSDSNSRIELCPIESSSANPEQQWQGLSGNLSLAIEAAGEKLHANGFLRSDIGWKGDLPAQPRDRRARRTADSSPSSRAAQPSWPVDVTIALGHGPEWDDVRRHPVLLAIAAAAVGLSGESASATADSAVAPPTSPRAAESALPAPPQQTAESAPSARAAESAAAAPSAQTAESASSAPAPRCTPNHPPAPPDFEREERVGFVLATFTVGEDGVVRDVEIDPVSSPDLVANVKAWLPTCPYSPARRDGKPVEMRETTLFRFRPATLAPPQLYGARLSRPTPKKECVTDYPPAPLTAAAVGLRGIVTAAYDVEVDGRVSAVTLYRNTGDPILFDGVRAWLLGCPREPARDENGKPYAVRMIESWNVGRPLPAGRRPR